MVARTLSYESCEFDLVDGIGSDDVTQVYNKASQLWGDLHSQLGERTRKMASNARVEENVKRWEKRKSERGEGEDEAEGGRDRVKEREREKSKREKERTREISE